MTSTDLHQTLPHAESAQIYQLQDKVATALFGDDAYIGDSTMLKPEVGTFAKTLLTITWNRYRKGVKRDVRQMDTAFAQVTQLWDGKFFRCDNTCTNVLFDSIQREGRETQPVQRPILSERTTEIAQTLSTLR